VVIISSYKSNISEDVIGIVKIRNWIWGCNSNSKCRWCLNFN